MNTNTIEQKLNNITGFKAIFSGLFGGIKAKKSFKVYSTANKKGVYKLHKVRHATHEDNQYAIYVFCPDHEIPSEALQLITDRCRDLSLGVIRYDSISYTFLQRWRGEEGSSAYEATDITSIAPEYPDIFIVPIAFTEDCSCVIYAKNEKGDYVYPLTDKKLAALLK